jgi:hypothetical protein
MATSGAPGKWLSTSVAESTEMAESTAFRNFLRFFPLK